MARTVRLCPVTSHRFRIKKRSEWVSQPYERRVGSFDISLSSPWCHDTHLACLMVWANDWFPRFQVTIADTLNAHTYMALGHQRHGPLSERKASELARTEGEKWHARHASLIADLLGSRAQVFHWDDWLARPDFAVFRERIQNLARCNSAFRAAIDSDIVSYLRRRGLPAPQAERELDRLRAYILDELAVYQQQASDGVINLYPGSESSTLRFIRVNQPSPGLLHPQDFVYFEFCQGAA